MQNKEVKIDLRVSRRESGLLQTDLAHLLGTTQPRISRLEQGKAVLTLEEVIQMTVIFGKSSIELFRLLSQTVKHQLAGRLSSLSPDPVCTSNPEARQLLLSRLSTELSAFNETAYGEQK